VHLTLFQVWCPADLYHWVIHLGMRHLLLKLRHLHPHPHSQAGSREFEDDFLMMVMKQTYFILYPLLFFSFVKPRI